MTKDEAIQQAVEAFDRLLDNIRGIEQVSNRVEDQAIEALAALRAAQSEPAPSPAPVQPVTMRTAEEWAAMWENRTHAMMTEWEGGKVGTFIGFIGAIRAEALSISNAKWENRRMEFHKFAYSTKAEMDALKDEIESLQLAASATGIPQIPECHTLWLWKNGHYYLAYDNPYPCKTVGGDPLTLGEPSAYAVFKASVNGREEYECPKLPRLPDSAPGVVDVENGWPQPWNFHYVRRFVENGQEVWKCRAYTLPLKNGQAIIGSGSSSSEAIAATRGKIGAG